MPFCMSTVAILIGEKDIGLFPTYLIFKLLIVCPSGRRGLQCQCLALVLSRYPRSPAPNTVASVQKSLDTCLSNGGADGWTHDAATSGKGTVIGILASVPFRKQLTHPSKLIAAFPPGAPRSPGCVLMASVSASRSVSGRLASEPLLDTLPLIGRPADGAGCPACEHRDRPLHRCRRRPADPA